MSREPERRALRSELKQALESGDRNRADALQARLLETMRQDRPRSFAPAETLPSHPHDPPHEPPGQAGN